MFDTILGNSFLPLYGLVVLLSIWRYPRYFDTPLRYLPILLMYTFLNELLGYLIRHYEEFNVSVKEISLNNWLIFNIYNIIFFLYFYYVFWNYIKDKSRKRIILIGAGIFAIASIINLFIQQFSTTPQLYSYATGGLVLMVIILFYFEQLKKTFDLWFLNRDLISWLSVGMFVFYLGYIPIKFFRHYIAIYDLEEVIWVRRIHLLLILFMYGSFAIGFIRMRRLRHLWSNDD